MDGVTVALLTQPRFLGFWFAPVSFWLAFRGAALIAVIAEVNNTFGQRHSYLCHRPDFAAIGPEDRIKAEKLFHVSPFQRVAGSYSFGFRIEAGGIDIVIAQSDGREGVVARMWGTPKPLRQGPLLAAALRRPGGALRVLALIYWHALRLKLKGAAYRRLPPLPAESVTRAESSGGAAALAERVPLQRGRAAR